MMDWVCLIFAVEVIAAASYLKNIFFYDSSCIVGNDCSFS